MNKFWGYIADNWQQSLLAVLGVAICFGIYFFRINTLVSGYSTNELAAVSQVTSGRRIVENPVYLPHKLMQYTLVKIDHSGVRSMRFVSVLFGTLAGALFFYIMRRWHSIRVAILTSIVFAFSSWMFHASRSAEPDILLVVLPLLLAATGIYIKRSRRDVFGLHVGAAIAGMSLYIPLGWVLVLPVLLWRTKSFITGKSRPKWGLQLSSISLFLIIILPLIYASAADTNILRELSGISGVPMWRDVLNTLATLASTVFVKAITLTPDAWLGSLPILDIASSVLFLLGVYTYSSWFSLQRTKLLGMALFVLLIMVGVSGNIEYIGILIPLIYVGIAGGITYLLKQWFEVFPRNPIARNIGASMLTVLVLLMAFYHTNRYFVAWPLSPNTQTSFTTIQEL